MLTLRILAGVALAAWVWLALVRGMYWRTNIRLPPAVDPTSTPWPSVAIIVPARDEADVLPLTLSTLVAQDYPGRTRVILVDDNSTDSTAALVAERWPDITVIAPGEPPDGWAGKLWALRAGVAAADNATTDSATTDSATTDSATTGCAADAARTGIATADDATAGLAPPGTAPPGTATPGTAVACAGFPGRAVAGAGSPGAVTPGAVTPSAVTPGTAAPGTAAPGTAAPGTAVTDTAEPSAAEPGTAATDTVTPDTSVTDSAMPDTVVTGNTSLDGASSDSAAHHADGFDYLLLTDADIAHERDSLALLIGAAEANQLDLVSQMARLRVRTGWERLIVPAFVYFFALLYPFRWSNKVGARTAAAAGGCVLVRRAALTRAGGLDAIRDAVIDDVALARVVKRAGGRTFLGLADHVDSIRPYPELESLWQMVARSAFAQLHRSLTLLAGTVVGLALVFWAPPVCLVSGAAIVDAPTLLFGAAGYALMTALYVPMLRYYRLPWPMALALPWTATLYLGMTVDSAVQHFRGRGAAWKGRTYSGRQRRQRDRP